MTTVVAPKKVKTKRGEESGRSVGSGKFLWVIESLVVIMCLLWLIPTIGLFLTSLRPRSEANANGWWNVFANPAQITIDNYREVMTTGAIPFGDAFINSMTVAIPATIIPILIAAFAAYVFTFMEFKGRDVLFIVIGILSLKTTAQEIRKANDFDWGPILEVGKLFLGIFITIAPVLAMLKVGMDGHFAPLVSLAHNAQGEPINAVYFWMSGMLSAFLDNAPTYLVFFNLASGDAVELMSHMSSTLLAVSMGSVFMGALSYIGNAPNFMVKAIAEQNRVKMPSFFGYMAWSFGILVPLFIIHTLIFFI